MRRNVLAAPRSRRCAAAILVTACLGIPGLASADDQPPSAGDTALARSLGSEGIQLADAGNCAAAIDKLQRAEMLYHAPTILGRLGECQVAVGKIVAGTENLQRVTRDPLPPRAPKAFVDAQARAQKVLASALPKLAKLKIHVDMPQGVTPVVKLDGETVSLAALDLDRPADPGPHHLEASAPGYRVAMADTNLVEGGGGAATLKLEIDPSAVAAAPPPGLAPTGTPPAPPSAPPATYGAATDATPVAPPVVGETKGGSGTFGYVLLGVGGAGVVVGSIFGVLALGKKSSLDDTCQPQKSNCPVGSQADVDSLHSFATGSTVGFVVGGLGLGSGLLVLLAAKPAAAHTSSLAPFVGPRSLGVTGSF